MRCVGTKGEEKKEPCRGLKGRHDFLIFLRNFIFIVSLPDSKVSQLLMDLLLSHSTLRLPGGTHGGGNWDFKGARSHTFQLGCNQGFKIKQRTKKDFFRMGNCGISLGPLTEVGLFCCKSSIQLHDT